MEEGFLKQMPYKEHIPIIEYLLRPFLDLPVCGFAAFEEPFCICRAEDIRPRYRKRLDRRFDYTCASALTEAMQQWDQGEREQQFDVMFQKKLEREGGSGRKGG
jgi:hypothetical protein